MDNITETIKRRLKVLWNITSTPGQGATRLPFSEEGKQAAKYLLNEMQRAGLYAWIDTVGNVRGMLPATLDNTDKDNVKTILMGSHYDTVKNGGEFDGAAGVICALSVVEYIKANCPVRKHNLEIIAFNDEEGCMFGSGCLGSKTLTGQVDQYYIEHLIDENGISIKEWIQKWNADPNDLCKEKLDLTKIYGFFEIHIEQGPVLDQENLDLGIVTGIVGLLRGMVEIRGQADHAGTTPMNMRKDSLEISAKVISHLDDMAVEQKDGSVATCGFIRAYPNAMNVIAEKTEFTIDLRSINQHSIDVMENRIRKILDEKTQCCNAAYDIDVKLRQAPVFMEGSFVKTLGQKCRDHEYRYKKIVSGAAHDAMIFADKVPTAMVFVPTIQGRSHCPDEKSDYSQLAKATKIVYETIGDLMVKEEP